MNMNLKTSFVSYLVQKYPDFTTELIDPLISPNLLSPFQVSLSQDTVSLIQTEIQKYWKLRQWGIENLQEQFHQKKLRQPKNFSVCMSYDFHVNPENGIDLIEINTNASFLALGLEAYQFLNLKESSSGFTDQKLIRMFENENQLLGNKDFKLAIIDKNPQQQNLYVEFLLYQAMFKNRGIACDIANIDEFEKMKQASFVYNRHTDFYLETAESETIRQLYNENKIQLSPQPYEYFLLADKARFIDWTTQNDVEKPASLLPTYDLGVADKDFIWSQRKQFFFKPKTAFGGKQTYKGASISRKVFEEVTNSSFIAQKISPPSEIEVELNGQKVKMKYDLRCYAYQDELQLIMARLYQGQTTNLRTEGGGFACVVVN